MPNRPKITVSTAKRWNEVTFDPLRSDMLPGRLLECAVGTDEDGRLKITVPAGVAPGSKHTVRVNEGTNTPMFAATMTLTRDPNDRSGSYQETGAGFEYVIGGAGDPPPGKFVVNVGDVFYVTVCTSIGAKVATPGYTTSVRFEIE